MYKSLAILVIICLASFLVAACGGGGGGTPNPTPPIVPDDNDQPITPPTNYWGNPFLGTWHLHLRGGNNGWLDKYPEDYHGYPLTANAEITYTASGMRVSVSSELADAWGRSSTTMVHNEDIEDKVGPYKPDQLRYPGIFTYGPPMPGDEQHKDLIMRWFDAPVPIGTDMDPWLVYPEHFQPLQWDEAIGFWFAIPPTNGTTYSYVIIYLAHKV